MITSVQILKPLEVETTRNRLIIYNDVSPSPDITVDRLLDLGTRRQNLLRDVNDYLVKLSLKKTSSDNEAIQFKKILLENRFSYKDDIDSHVTLMLVNCHKEEDRLELVRQETSLFRLKCKYDSMASEISNLVKSFVPSSEFISFNDIDNIPIKVYSYFSKRKTSSDNFLIKLEMGFMTYNYISRRDKCVVSNGNVYMLESDAIDILINKFEEGLKQRSAQFALRINAVKLNGTFNSAIATLQSTASSKIDYSDLNTHTLDSKNISLISEQSFPMCMSYMFDRGKELSHLKHTARLQFGSFLVHAGLPVEEALIFWRALFSKRFTPEKFDKEHAYNVRHWYGYEGHKKKVSSFSCRTIIGTTTENDMEFHGCPFKKLKSKVEVEARVKKMVENTFKKANLTFSEVTSASEEVLEHAKNGHYQLACTCVYQKSHKDDTVVINHPLEYYTESRNHYQNLDNGTK